LNKAYVKASATETAVIQSLAENNVVHLATHTLIDPEMPGRSRLIFRQDAQHDGLLQQQELFGLTIHSELIFLNSCGSALGQIIPGDGVWGFIAALRYAGADAIVATLWPVADQPSAFLSSGFFSHYANGLPATEALSLAKRAMIQQPEKFRVRDWAGYTLFQ
jgi:CHAT domain-containing protein